MNCRMVRSEIKAYIDGELGPVTRFLVTRHIARCEECRKELVEMSDLTAQVKNAAQATPPEGLRTKVLGRFELKPQAVSRRTRWPYKTSPAAFVGVMLMTVVVAAILFPMFARSRGGEVATLASAPSKSAPIGVRSPWSDEDASVPGAAPASAPTPRFRSPRVAAKHAGSATAAQGIAADTTAHATIDAQDYLERPAATPNLQIIKTADIKLQVRDFQPAYDDAVSMARSVGGYVTDSSAETTGRSPTSGTLTMRVPVSAFERVTARLGGLGKVLAKNISGEDVTGEVVDLESRIRNKRAEERQYLDIMNRAKRIPDIMSVSNELYRVRGEIEESQGRLKYLKSSAAMSTINLELAEKQKAKPTKSSLHRAWDDAIGSLIGTGRGLASILIWLAVYSPFWALPIAAWLLLKRREARAQG